MPVHPKTQAALDAAHAALDDIRNNLKPIPVAAEQAATVEALEAFAASLSDVPLPVAPEGTETKKPAKTTKAAKKRR